MAKPKGSRNKSAKNKGRQDDKKVKEGIESQVPSTQDEEVEQNSPETETGSVSEEVVQPEVNENGKEEDTALSTNGVNEEKNEPEVNGKGEVPVNQTETSIENKVNGANTEENVESAENQHSNVTEEAGSKELSAAETETGSQPKDQVIKETEKPKVPLGSPIAVSQNAETESTPSIANSDTITDDVAPIEGITSRARSLSIRSKRRAPSIALSTSRSSSGQQTVSSLVFVKNAMEIIAKSKDAKKNDALDTAVQKALSK